MKYRKKPVVIEAKQLTDNSMWDVYHWIEHNGGSVREWAWDADDRYIVIRTLEGDHKTEEGDFVIQGVKGEFYPCKPDIFAMTYEAAE